MVVRAASKSLGPGFAVKWQSSAVCQFPICALIGYQSISWGNPVPTDTVSVLMRRWVFLMSRLCQLCFTTMDSKAGLWIERITFVHFLRSGSIDSCSHCVRRMEGQAEEFQPRNEGMAFVATAAASASSWYSDGECRLISNVQYLLQIACFGLGALLLASLGVVESGFSHIGVAH